MNTIKILLLEDDIIDQMAFKRCIKTKNLPYDYRIVGSLTAAYELFNNNEFDFDIVVSDYNLGDGTALEILDQILATNTPVIISTGSGDEEVAVKAMKAGAYDYLIKDPERNYLKVLPLTVENAIKLKKSEEQSKLLSHAIKNIYDSVYITDINHNIIFVNDAFCQTYGYSEQEIIGKSMNILKQNEHFEAEREEILSQDFPEVWQGEVYHRRKDGSMFPISLSYSTIYGINYNQKSIVSVARDITEKKLAEQELRKALEQEKELNELKSNFISMVSHDFRSPISGIITCVNLIKDYRNQLSEAETFEYLELILKTCQQMLQLLEDVLVIGKADAGKIQSNAIEINIQQYCQELMAEFQLSDQNQHKFHFAYQGITDQQIFIDKNALRHILSNLLSNALKYSPSGTTIQLNIETKEHQMLLEIQDEGIGIPPKAQQHLFELFYRGSNVGEIPGTGLGLAIVKKYVDILGGQINFTSQVDSGTTFSVVLLTKPTEVFSL